MRAVFRALSSSLLLAWLCLILMLSGLCGWSFFTYSPAKKTPEQRVVVPVRDVSSADSIRDSTPHAGAVDAKSALSGDSPLPTTPTDGKGAAHPLPQDPSLLGNHSAAVEGHIKLLPFADRPVYKYSKKALVADSPLPKIVIVLTGVGVDAAVAEKALVSLPPAISFAFSAYAAHLPQWLKRSSDKGHESLVVVPMEPDGFPQNDPGPLAILTQHTQEQDHQRLQMALQNSEGVVGVAHTMGNKMAEMTEKVSALARHVSERGLLWFDAQDLSRPDMERIVRQVGGLYAKSVVTIDDEVSKATIGMNLQLLEENAKKNGMVIAVASAYPLTVEQLATWSQTLAEKGIILAPLTAALEQSTSPHAR